MGLRARAPRAAASALLLAPLAVGGRHDRDVDRARGRFARDGRAERARSRTRPASPLRRRSTWSIAEELSADGGLAGYEVVDRRATARSRLDVQPWGTADAPARLTIGTSPDTTIARPRRAPAAGPRRVARRRHATSRSRSPASCPSRSISSPRRPSSARSAARPHRRRPTPARQRRSGTQADAHSAADRREPGARPDRDGAPRGGAPRRVRRRPARAVLFVLPRPRRRRD